MAGVYAYASSQSFSSSAGVPSPTYFWEVTQTLMFEKKITTDPRELNQNMWSCFLEDFQKLLKLILFKTHKEKSFFVSNKVTQTSMFASPYRFYAIENVGSNLQLKFTAGPKVSNTVQSFAESILSLQPSPT